MNSLVMFLTLYCQQLLQFQVSVKVLSKSKAHGKFREYIRRRFVLFQALAGLVKDEDLAKGSLYPPLSTIQDCSVTIATRLCEYAYKIGTASVCPKPDDMECFIRGQMYNTEYPPAIPSTYSFPKQ
jgi:hypothetical protein